MPSYDLPADASAAHAARRIVGRVLPELGVATERLADARLLVSELVTNAVLHASASARLEIQPRPGAVRIAVHDSSPTVPRIRRRRQGAVSGRGLRLVDVLALRWGVDVEGRGKLVWFDIEAGERPAPDPAIAGGR